VDGSREEPLEIGQGVADATLRGVVEAPRFPAGEQVLERELKAASQLRCRLAREGDGRHAIDAVGAAGHPGRHPPRHLVRFP
jgi:hypothetical protein